MRRQRSELICQDQHSSPLSCSYHGPPSCVSWSMSCQYIYRGKIGSTNLDKLAIFTVKYGWRATLKVSQWSRSETLFYCESGEVWFIWVSDYKCQMSHWTDVQLSTFVGLPTHTLFPHRAKHNEAELYSLPHFSASADGTWGSAAAEHDNTGMKTGRPETWLIFRQQPTFHCRQRTVLVQWTHSFFSWKTSEGFIM